MFLLNSTLLNANNKAFFQDVSFDCTSCKMWKSKTLPFPMLDSLALKCFYLVLSDVWGIEHVLSHSHFKYFVTFIDEFGRFMWIYFLQSKFEVCAAFQVFLAYAENQFSTSVKTLHTNCGEEYISKEFQQFLQQKRIISQRTCPYTPQQNGVSERKGRHLLDRVRSLLLESSVPTRFWPKALPIAVHLINRLPSPRTEYQTPYYRLFQTQPMYSHLHTFGCVCVLFFFLQRNEQNYLSNPPTVHFLDMPTAKKGSFAMNQG